MGWYLSPSGWPTHAPDNSDTELDLQDLGYTPIDEADVQAAIDAFNAGIPASPENVLTQAELLALTQDTGSDFSTELRAAFGLGATATDLAVAAFLETEGTQSRKELVTAARKAQSTWLGAERFTSGLSGSPTRVDTGQDVVWQLTVNTAQVIRASQALAVPPDLVDIDLVWTNASASAGTAQLRVDYGTQVDGASTSTYTNVGSTLLTQRAPAQNVRRYTTVAQAVKLTPGVLRFLVRTTGIGTLAANAIGVLGLRIRPTIRLDPDRLDEVPLPGELANVHNENGAAFIRDNIVTVGTDQYAVWVRSPDRHAIIGKRTIGSDTWATFDLSSLAGAPLGASTTSDGHNAYSIGVDPSGHLHVSGNHHDDALRYVVSTNPGDITAWAAADLSGVPSANRNSVTYVQFITGPDGALWVWLRQGGSGDGAMFCNKWNDTTRVLNHVSRPLSGFTVDGVDPTESPYVHTPAISADGVWHLWFVWRTTADLATTHDFGYMKSADGGVTWTSASGTALPAITNPSTDTPALIWTGFRDQINQCGAAVDSTNRPHTVQWERDTPTGASILRHYWVDAGVVHVEDEHYPLRDTGAHAGASPTFRSRPQPLAYGGRVFVIYADWPVPGIDGAVAPRAFTRWWLKDITPGGNKLAPFVFLTEDMGNNEFPYDRRYLADTGKLAILVTRTGTNGSTSGGDLGVVGYDSEPGRIVTLDLADVVANPPA